MDANNFAGSDFLKAADLGQATPQITVSKVESVDFDQGEKSKLVIHATDPQCKPVVLNVTNTRACIAAWGPETQGWLGKVAMLSVRQTQMGPGIGVTPMMAPTSAAVPNPAAVFPAAQPTAAPHGVPFDDDIPFG